MGTRPIDANGKAGEFVFQSYEKIDERVTNVSTGLMLADLVPPALKLESGDRRVMGIFVKDMAEWVIAEQACNRINGQSAQQTSFLLSCCLSYAVDHTQ